ncbi:hypothetical protein G7Y79_00029g063090 [Physcia stellaris]|nr:hypothetical protein G7Y79_00029g063090 [Physcia stellaris]
MEGIQTFIHSTPSSSWFQEDVLESTSAIRTCLAAFVQIASAAAITCYNPEHRSVERTLHIPHIESEVAGIAQSQGSLLIQITVNPTEEHDATFFPTGLATTSFTASFLLQQHVQHPQSLG